jgi:hypothetical protein
MMEKAILWKLLKHGERPSVIPAHSKWPCILELEIISLKLYKAVNEPLNNRKNKTLTGC